MASSETVFPTEIPAEFRGTYKAPPPRTQVDIDEAAAKEVARKAKWFADQKAIKEKKLTDLLGGYQDIEKFGGDLEKFPGGTSGPRAANARAQVMRWGNTVSSLPGEGSAFEKIKNHLQAMQSPVSSSRELVKYNPKEAVVDIGSELVRPKATGLGKAVGAFSKVAGGLAKGLAQAPAYEFLNPPSAGPSDPEDPVYQFERGLISQEEFLRKMGK
jgi:hypothetical protein